MDNEQLIMDNSASATEQSRSLPKAWEIKKLGEIGKVCMCKRILKKQTLPIGDIPFYKIGTFGKKPNAFITKEVYEEYRAKYSFPNKGDILLSASGTIGRRVIYDGKPAYFQDSNIVWIDNNEKKILNEYLYKFYGFCDWNPSKGATISRLYNDDLRKIEIPIPPLPEQKRIVSILDKTFAEIAKAKANAQQNLKNAKELFESYLQGVFENKGDDWVEKELIEICNEITDGSHFSPKTTSKDIYPYITVRDIDNDIINFSNCKFINKSNYKTLIHNGCKPNKGDLLFSKDGTVGKVSLVDFEKEFVVLSSLAIIRPKSEIIHSSLLKYILKDPLFLKTAIGMKTGVAIRRIILRNLKKIVIVFPKSVKEQKQIVKKLDVLSAETKKLEAVYQQKINDLEELKKSVLQKAFNGEL